MTPMTSAGDPAARELPLAPGGSVEITMTAGDLRLRGTEGDRVVVRARDGDPLGEDVAVELHDDVVRVGDAQWGLRIGPFSVGSRRSRDLDVEVPRGARVSVRTLSGDVEASGLAGPSRWASASGDLRVATAAGPVQVETMSGSVVLEASGAIDLGARTVSGDLRVRAPRLDSTDVGTTSGDVHLDAALAVGGRHAVSSVSGDVDVATPSPVRLEARTIAGEVRGRGDHRAEGGRGQRTLVAGDGSVALSVRTTSGDVLLRATGSAGRAEAPVVSGGAPSVPGVPPIPGVPPGPGVPPVPGVPPAPRPATPPEAPEPPRPTDGTVAGAVPARPITDEDTQAWSAPEPAVDRREAARLDILRALERGELDVETASRRLETLEDAGPRSFKGWC